MKPFELTVYPPLTDTEKMSVSLTLSTGLNVWHTPPPGFLESKRKRLTNAELAAEYESARCDALLLRHVGYYWAPLNDTWAPDQESVDKRANTLLRFATLPHYDEVPE